MKKRTLYTILGLVFAAAAIFAGIKVFQGSYAPEASISEAYAPTAAAAATPAPTAPPSAAEEEPAALLERTPEATAAPDVSPVDFDALQSVNPDIYGWLEIPGADISLPIVQSPTDDSFYLNHNSDGEYSANGAVFSEATYNTNDFSDPVTFLYGHHMRDGAIFGNLQQYYSDASFFAENPTFTVYTPDGTLTYGVFAAVPYSGEHILYYNDFTDETDFTLFFETVFNVRDLSANFNEEYAPVYGDRVLVLSTCLIGNNTRRFLVMGTLLP